MAATLERTSGTFTWTPERVVEADAADRVRHRTRSGDARLDGAHEMLWIHWPNSNENAFRPVSLYLLLSAMAKFSHHRNRYGRSFCDCFMMSPMYLARSAFVSAVR